MISRKLVVAFAVSLIGSFSATDAQAQNTRDGFWFSGGLGYGSLSCEGCGSREGGVSGNLSLGGTLSPRWLIGGGTSGWSKSEQGATLTVAVVDARIRFYPQTKGGFFLTGGIGVGSVSGSVGGFSSTETGGGVILGVGYDVRVSGNTSITPYWNHYGMKNSNTDANVGQIGLAVTWH